MEGRNKKTLDLDSLMLHFGEMSVDEIKEAGRKLFSKIFLKDGAKGYFYTHDDESIVIYSDRFDHAFFNENGKKEIDVARVKRMRWVKCFVSGSVPSSECWEKTVSGIVKRYYLSFNKPYIVCLNRKTSGWTFKTAFPTTQKYLATNVTKDATLIKRFK